MDPESKYPLPREALEEFSKLTLPKDMVTWNEKHTPWMFEIKGCDPAVVAAKLQEQYEKDIDRREKAYETYLAELKKCEETIQLDLSEAFDKNPEGGPTPVNTQEEPEIKLAESEINFKTEEK